MVQFGKFTWKILTFISYWIRLDSNKQIFAARLFCFSSIYTTNIECAKFIEENDTVNFETGKFK